MLINLLPAQNNPLFAFPSNSGVYRQVSNTNAQFVNVSYDLNNYAILLDRLVNNKSNKWILFIAPPGKPKFDFLAAAGIAKSRVITLNEQQFSNKNELLISTLKSGNYSAIISWQASCPIEQKEMLEKYASKTKTECFLFCDQ